MPAHVLLIGSGEIGTRHLQAAASLKSVGSIDVVDARPEGLALGQSRVKEISDAQPSIQYRWLSKLSEAKREGDLCVIATQAAGRLDLVRAASELGYKNFLLEKVVTQSVAEFEALMALAENESLQIWVNCKTRAYPFHKTMVKKFDPEKPIQFHVVGGNHGLACNGVHSIDLFFFYDRSQKLFPVHEKIDPILHPSKRGSDILDLSGSMTALSEKGSLFSITFNADHNAPPAYFVSNHEQRFTLDQWQPWANESSLLANWAWTPVPFEGKLNISDMSKTFINDILLKGECELPSLVESFPAHRYMLGTLQPYFEKLTKRELVKCPVT